MSDSSPPEPSLPDGSLPDEQLSPDGSPPDTDATGTGSADAPDSDATSDSSANPNIVAPVGASGEAIGPFDATLAAPSVPDDLLPEESFDTQPSRPSALVSDSEAATAHVDLGTPTKRSRTWPQRLLLTLNCVVILACFAGAGVLLVSRQLGNSFTRVELSPSLSPVNTRPPVTDATGATVAPVETTPGATVTVETLPEADPEAKNFLITGADNNACIDPNSPYAGAFGDRTTMGERSDTIMLMRVNPATKQAAVLSFPRDLWVTIAGTNNKGRINSAYVRDDPTKLIETIGENFFLGVDHFMQIDFCAFKKIVEGLEGVSVPFDFPARDTNTGLDVPTTGCYKFDGDHALAYVRSRHYEYFVDGKWKKDPVGDLGRISRQQDFLRRVLSAALDRGITDPGVARSLIDAAQQNIVVDKKLTITRMLEFTSVLRNFEPGTISTYQIESVSDMVSGNSVQIPKIKGDNMKAILDIFRGVAPLAGAPQQVFETTTTSAAPGATPTTAPANGTATTVAAPPATVVGPAENVLGVVPPEDVRC